MGLDMYLKAEKYLAAYDWCEESDKLAYRDVLKAIRLPQGMTGGETPSLTVQVNVAYWRKANHIHGWFITHCARGVDDCKDVYVSREDLETLRDTCKHLLVARDPEEAQRLMEPTEGFFFGGTEIDDYYWSDLEDTVTQLDRVLAIEGPYEFIYRASW